MWCCHAGMVVPEKISSEVSYKNIVYIEVNIRNVPQCTMHSMLVISEALNGVDV